MKRKPILTSTSKYGVSNDSHFTSQSSKLTFIVDGTYKFHYWDGYKGPATHFYYKGYDTSGSILKPYTAFTQDTNNNWIGVSFSGISSTFADHSTSFGMDNGNLDGGLCAQLMIKISD